MHPHRRLLVPPGVLLLAAAAGCALESPEEVHASTSEATTGDRRDPAGARGDRVPATAEVWGRKIALHLSDDDNGAWGSIDAGDPGDEVWLDRSWNGGGDWEPKLGKTKIPDARRGWRTMMYSVDELDRFRVGAVRACGKAGNRSEIACTPWFHTKASSEDRVDAAATALMGMYDAGKGQWPIGWWRSANALTALLDYDQKSGTTTYRYAIDITFDKNKEHDFTNEFMDDTGWWGLAWVRAYDVTGDKRYLDMARRDADYIWSFEDDHCGGGIWWNNEKKYKNAITNELFVKLAASVYNRTGQTVYRDRALATYRWFKASGMVNQWNLVNDGLTADCKNNGGNPWTYNQGVILGGLVELRRATGDASLLDDARALADASTTSAKVSPNGIAHEICEDKPDSCGADATSFKGIYVRNLGELNRALPDRPYDTYLHRQADTLHARDRNTLDQYGLKWRGPFDHADAARQHCALDALTAASF